MYCTKCGTELTPNAKFCANCGNSLVSRAKLGRTKTPPREIRVDSSQSLQAQGLRCPRCSSNDQVQKVSAIVASQTQEISGGSWETQVYVDKKGKKHTEDHYTPYSGTQMSVLAQRLSPPEKPDAGFSTGIIIAIGFLMVAGVCGLLGLFTIMSSSLSVALADASFYVLCITPTFVFGVLGILLFLVSSISHREKVTQVKQVEIPRWEKAMRRWEQLYYCYRDDNIFIPHENVSVAVPQMKTYIYQK